MLWGENRGKWKGWQPPGVEPRTPLGRAQRGIQYHLCSTCRGLWGLVVVQLSWLSARALVAQARDVLGSTPGGCWPIHFPLFAPHNISIILPIMDLVLRSHTGLCNILMFVFRQWSLLKTDTSLTGEASINDEQCAFPLHSYSSGGEDGYVRVHTFDPSYFEFKFEWQKLHMWQSQVEIEQSLFHCVFWSCYYVQTAVAQNFHQERGSCAVA